MREEREDGDHYVFQALGALDSLDSVEAEGAGDGLGSCNALETHWSIVLGRTDPVRMLIPNPTHEFKV